MTAMRGIGDDLRLFTSMSHGRVGCEMQLFHKNRAFVGWVLATKDSILAHLNRFLAHTTYVTGVSDAKNFPLVHSHNDLSTLLDGPKFPIAKQGSIDWALLTDMLLGKTYTYTRLCSHGRAVGEPESIDEERA